MHKADDSLAVARLKEISNFFETIFKLLVNNEDISNHRINLCFSLFLIFFSRSNNCYFLMKMIIVSPLKRKPILCKKKSVIGIGKAV